MTVKPVFLRIMNSVAIRSIVVPWLGFLLGLSALAWLHTFQERLVHQAIGPLFVLFWIFLLALAWDGCKAVRPKGGFRYILFSFQMALSIAVCLWFFHYLINQSP